MKIKILLFSANPRNTNNLRLAEEFRTIKESIGRSKYRDKFEVIQGEAVRQKDLRRLLLDKAPHIVHFSGHAKKQGLFLENDQGHLEVISGEKLEELFSLFESISCVVLNACYSSSQAEHLVNVVPYIIGMQQSIKDSDAIDFAEGFYDAIGSNRSIPEAFKFGVNAILGKEDSHSNRSLYTDIDDSSSAIPVLLKGNISRSLPNLGNQSFKYKIPVILTGMILLGFVAYKVMVNPTIIQNAIGNNSTVAGRDVNQTIINNNNGLTKEQYEIILKKQLDQYFQASKSGNLNKEQRQQLEIELKALQQKLTNIEASYKEEKKRRESAVTALEKFKDQLPASQIEKAEASLREGDAIEAEKTFDQIIEKGAGAIALAAYQSGQLAEGRIDYIKALRQYKKAVALEENNPDYLMAAGQMARTLGKYQQAQEWLEQLLSIRQADKKQGIDLADAQYEVAFLYKAQGKFEQAEPLYQRSLSMMEKALGKDHPSVATTLNNLAELYRIQGKYEQAKPLYKRDLSIMEKAQGKDHPSVATTLNNLALLYEAQGKYEEAEPLYKRSLSITEKALGKDHPSVATTLNNLALLYKAQGKYEQAEPLYKRSLSITEKALGEDHPLIATTLNNLAELYRIQGKYEQAESLYKRSLSIWEKVLGIDHSSVATTLNNLALLYKAQGKYEQAEPLYQRSLIIYEKALGKDHPLVATTLNNLAVLYAYQKKYKEAIPLSQRAIAILKKTFSNGHSDIDMYQNNLKAIQGEIN